MYINLEGHSYSVVYVAISRLIIQTSFIMPRIFIIILHLYVIFNIHMLYITIEFFIAY